MKVYHDSKETSWDDAVKVDPDSIGTILEIMGLRGIHLT